MCGAGVSVIKKNALVSKYHNDMYFQNQLGVLGAVLILKIIIFFCFYNQQ